MRTLNLFNLFIGFIILSVLNDFVKDDLIFSSYNYRVFSVVLSLLVILKVFFKVIRSESSAIVILFKSRVFKYYIVFVLLYLLRIGLDMFFFNNTLSPSDNGSVLAFLYAVSFVLIIPISYISIWNLNHKTIFKFGYWISAIPFLIHAFLNMSRFGLIEDRASNFENVGVNTLGLYSSLIAGWSFTRIVNSKNSFFDRISSFVVFSITVYVMSSSATRSVFVALAIVIILYLIVNFKQIGKINYLVYLSLFIGILIFTYSIWGDWLELVLIRFQYGIDTGRTGRDLIYSKAFELFKLSPIFGYSHVIKNFAYFHNSFLDAFVSTGLVGGVLFSILNYNAVKICYKFLKSEGEYKYYAIGYFITFIYGLFSSNLYSSVLYWSYLIIILTLDVMRPINDRTHMIKERK